MGKPRTNYEDKASGAISELISAQSALNMLPSPVAEPDGEYLADTDTWAAHAYEHISAAIELIAAATGIPRLEVGEKTSWIGEKAVLEKTVLEIFEEFGLPAVST